MKNHYLISAVVLTVSLLTACSSAPKPGDTVIEQQVIESNTITATAVIVGIDKENRAVTIEHSNRLTTLYVSPQLTHFSELEVGDIVKTQFTESVALHVQAHDGSARLQSSGDLDTSTKGGGISASEKTEIIADILAIDKENNTVTVKGPQGSEMMLPVEQHPEYLEKISVGDQVVVTYTKAVVISIEEQK
ncbi:putative periplasmic lipoprotein [Vibrio comitans]